MKNKTLYLAADEDKSFGIIRRIERYNWISIENRDYLIVDVDVPVDLTKDDTSNSLTKTLYLSNRFVDQIPSFKALSPFPIYVNILTPKSVSVESPSSPTDFINIAWATLYDNLKDAEDHRIV